MKHIATDLARWSRVAVRTSRIREPVFLTGTVRSGSTLLARCLGTHPGLYYAGFELSREWSDLGGVSIACPDTEDSHCPERSGRSLDTEAVSRLERGLAAIVAAKGRVGARLLNKNPHLWNKLKLVVEAFPDAGLVITSRDIRSTVASILKLWQWLHETRGIRHYLPPDSSACWDCIPPRSPEGIDSRRLFPGGDVQVLAEYWLRCYERIEADVHLFSRREVVKHRDFIIAPDSTLNTLWNGLGLSPVPVELPVKIDRSRNSRWGEVLSADDAARLDEFIRMRIDRIQVLTCADNAA